MLTTTGYNFEGYTITKYIEVISEAIVLGTGFLSTLSASFADLTGTRSTSYSNKLQEGKEAAMEKLQEKAKRLGGNAIIGIDIDYTTFSNDVMGIIATGTVVQIEKEKGIDLETKKFVFPVLSYNSYIPFNICTLNLIQNIFSKSTVGSLSIKNYAPEKNVTALVVDIELEEIFGRKHNIQDIVFTCNSVEEKKSYSTDYLALNLDEIQMSLINKVFVFTKKFIVNDDGRVIVVEQENYKKNNLMTSAELGKLRFMHGDDSVCAYSAENGIWHCYCGADNQDGVDLCNRCGRKITEFKIKIGNTEVKEKITFDVILEEANKKENAQEIYEYLLGLDLISLVPLLEEIQELVKGERLWGSMKRSAIIKIKKYMEENN